MQALYLGSLHICSKYAAWYSCGIPNKWGRDGLVLDPYHWIPFRLHGLHVWTSVREDGPKSLMARCPRVDDMQGRGFIFSEEMRGNGRKDFSRWDCEERKKGTFNQGVK